MVAAKQRTLSQIGKNNKSKGSTFERLVARELTKWWNEGEFHRTPASGALHWKKDERVSGDIVPPKNSSFPFSVECKNHEGIILDQLITNMGQFPSFWNQCSSDALTYSKIPMLVFKRSRIKPWVVLPFNSHLMQAARDKRCPVFHFYFYGFTYSDLVAIQLEDLITIHKEDILSWYEYN